MDKRDLAQGFTELNELSKSEYHQTLDELQNDPTTPFDPSLQIGRLVGVVLKAPFADSVALPEQSTLTGAYRAWNLVGESRFNEPAIQNSWQHRVLQDIATTEGLTNAYALALDAHFERGFFGYLARSTCKYLCGDPQIRREIEKAVDDARKSGLDVTVKSPEIAVGSAGLTLGMLLIQHVPILGFVGAPVIAGLVVILYRIGIDAFCTWTETQLMERPVERE